MHPIRMSCLESTTDWYRDVGKDYVKDVDGNDNVRLAYAYDTPPSRVDKGDQLFFLTSMTTLVTEKIDILHHAQSSLEGKAARIEAQHSGIGWSWKLLREDYRPDASQPPILVRRRSRHRQGHG